MSETVQGSQPTQPQATPAYKPRKTLKSPAIQAQVLAKRVTGDSKAKIARDLGMAVNTVTSIIELTDFEREIEAGRISCVKLIGKGAQAIEKAFDKGDGALAVRMFEGLGILGNSTKTGNKAMGADLHLQQAINVLIQPSPSPIAVPQNSAIDAQVIDNKGQAS